MRFLAFLLALFCLVLPVRAGQLAIVSGADDGPQREFLSAFKAAIQGSAWQVRWEGSAERYQEAQPKGLDLVIATGSVATRALLAKPDGPPVLATLLSRSAYEAALAENPQRRSPVSALYLDQPLGRQLALIRKLFPRTNRLLTVVSGKTADQLPELKRQAGLQGLQLEAEQIGPDEALVPVLNRLLVQDGVFLALPDNQVFARDNIRPLLLTTYRYQRPVIAFSPAFVQAGALAALHTTPAQLAQEVALLLAQSKGERLQLPPPRGPARFGVAINYQVARSLKLDLPTEDEVLSGLSATGGDK